MKTQVVIGIVLLITTAVSAQQIQPRVLTSVEGNAVKVKFYIPELINDFGVNVYRRTVGDDTWVKLNDVPLRKGTKLSAAALANDNQLRSLVAMLDSVPRSDVKGLLLLSVLIKSFHSDAFSEYLGIRFTDSAARRGVIYEYRVARIRNDETIGVSDPVTAGEKTIEQPPADIEVSLRNSATAIRWRPEEGRYYGVNIYRKEAGGESTLITKQPVMVSKVKSANGDTKYPDIFYTDDTIVPGRNYTYELAAVDFFGRESIRSASFNIGLKDITPPPAPESVKAQADHAKLSVVLTWKKVNANDLAGYHVYRQDKSDQPGKRVNRDIVPAGKQTFTDVVTQAKTYYYYITAVDFAGKESQSVTVYAKVDDVIAPAAPARVTAVADTGRVTLTWATNNEPDVRGYIVYRSVSNDTKRLAPLFTTPVTDNSFEDKLPAGARNNFYYSVAAVDTAYNKSGFSTMVMAQLPDATPPMKPFIRSVSTNGDNRLIEWLPLVDRDVKHITLHKVCGNVESVVATLQPKSISFSEKMSATAAACEYFLTVTDNAGNTSLPSNRYSAAAVHANRMIDLGTVKASYDSLQKTVTVRWPTLDDVTGFVVYRKIANREPVALTGLIQEGEFADHTVEKGNQYTYRVKAFGREGIKGESAEALVIIE